MTRRAGSHGLSRRAGSITTTTGDLDLFVVNYCVWIPEKEPPCTIGKSRTYCHPRYYQGLPNELYRNNGDGTFTDVSVCLGHRRAHRQGYGGEPSWTSMRRPLDVFVANDTVPNFLFRNEGGGRFREVGVNVAVSRSTTMAAR